MNSPSLRPGMAVELADEEDCIVPAGIHTVSRINGDGSFHCGGNTAVWPRRIIRVVSAGPPGPGRDLVNGPARHVRIGKDWPDLGAKAAIVVLWLVSAALVASQ